MKPVNVYEISNRVVVTEASMIEFKQSQHRFEPFEPWQEVRQHDKFIRYAQPVHAVEVNGVIEYIAMSPDLQRKLEAPIEAEADLRVKKADAQAEFSRTAAVGLDGLWRCATSRINKFETASLWQRIVWAIKGELPL